MELIETAGTNGNGKNIEDVFREEINATEMVESPEINQDDFFLNEDEKNAYLNPEEKKAEVETEIVEEQKETVKTTEKTVIKDPEGIVTTKEVTTQTTGLNAVKAKSVKPNMMFIMWDMFVPKIGGAFAKDTPKEHWKLDPADKADLSVLITESASEGNWSGIATKWFLLLAVAAIIIVKVRTFKDGKKIAEDTTSKSKTLEEIYIEMKAAEESKKNSFNYEETIQRLETQNKLLQDMITDLSNGKKHEKSMYQETITNIEVESKIIQEANQILKNKVPEGSNIYEGYNLDEILFTHNGGFVDKDKAGQKGYNYKGVKIGKPSDLMKNLFEQWKIFHNKKNNYIPYFVV